MRILLITGNRLTAAKIANALRDEKMSMQTADTGDEGIEIAKVYDFDMIVLDLSLSDTRGYDVLRVLRKAKPDTPILTISRRGENGGGIESFNLGADDHLPVSFDQEELVARVHAIVRRTKGHAQSIIRTGKLALNLIAKTLEVEGRPVHLTGKEYQALALLSLRKGSAVSKDEFLDHLYGGTDEPDIKIVDVFICKIRKKVASATGGDNYIHTVWGRGYMLSDAVEEKDAA